MDHVMTLFHELYSGPPRQGPGCRDATARALALTGPSARSAILDIGCGSGAQSLDLLSLTGDHVTCVDTHPPFLEELRRRAEAIGAGDRVATMVADMVALDFLPESFDLIWSEGAIYIMGFEQGIASWRRFLKPGGFIAVTEISWFTDHPHPEPANFWRREYPDISTVAANLEKIREAGFSVAGHFPLPESAWWDDYYTPLENRIESFLECHPNDPTARAIADATTREIELYRNHAEQYGYEFYVMRRED